MYYYISVIRESIQQGFFWVMVALLFINILQRKHHDYSIRKRYASLYLACIAFFLYSFASIIDRYPFFQDWMLLPLIIAAAVLCVIWHRQLFPFRLRCLSCKQRLPFLRIICYDSNLCETDEEKNRVLKED